MPKRQAQVQGETQPQGSKAENNGRHYYTQILSHRQGRGGGRARIPAHPELTFKGKINKANTGVCPGDKYKGRRMSGRASDGLGKGSKNVGGDAPTRPDKEVEEMLAEMGRGRGRGE